MPKKKVQLIEPTPEPVHKHRMGRPPFSYKWGSLAKTHSIRLTDQAWDWFKKQGGADMIERQARNVPKTKK